MEDKISIILPIYNSEKYIKKCIESIICQTYKNIEILMIDDGSTDNSGEICKQYAKTDKRIKYIPQTENKGVSNARNIGMAQATGKYVMFVDSDDYVENRIVEVLYNNIKKYNADLSICSCCIEQDNNIEYLKSNLKESRVIDKIELINFMATEERCSGYLCNKMYKSEIIKGYNLKLRTDLHIMEDLVFNIEYSKYIKKAFWANDFFGYIYVQRNGSALNSRFSLKKVSKLYALDSIIESLKEYKDLLYAYKLIYQKAIIQYKFEMHKKEYRENRKINMYINENYSKYYKEVKEKTKDSKERIKLMFSYRFPYLYGYGKEIMYSILGKKNEMQI